MKKLAFVPFPLPEESPTSMLRRFALQCGCAYPADIVNLTCTVNLKCSAISSEGPLAKWIAARAGCFSERFLNGFYKPVGRFAERMPYQVYGTVIPNSLIRFSGNAFCSSCRAEGYDRFVKDLRPALYCPYHYRRYLFQCPICDRQLRWIDPMTDICSCGNYLESPECSAQDCALEQVLRIMVLENREDFFQQLKKTLNDLHYDKNLPSQHPENRDIFAVAIAIIQKDIVGIENYLSNLQSRYPEMPSAAIGAKLAGIKTPEALEVLRQYSNWTLLLTTAVSEKNSSDSDFTLYKSQVRKATAIRSSVLRDIALEHCNDWISFPNTKKIPPQVFLPLLEKCRKWKANARKDSLDPALFVTVEEASEMIMVDLYFIQKLVANGNLNLLRQANQKVKIRKI